MSVTVEEVLALEALETKIRAILPEQYQDSYEDVLPVSMGSAGLKYDADGQVAWDEMWATFCDLAMAGGPPHRGTLLEPATTEQQEKYRRVVDEICRGIMLVTGLPARPGGPFGVLVECRSAGMAAWLTRAIVMENVLAGHDGDTLFLPAGPDFRIVKEIKNVITVIAKTCHYWTDHMPADQQQSIDAMFATDATLLEPASILNAQQDPDAYRSVVDELTRKITERTGRVCFPNRYVGWIGVECADVRSAIWLMRAMVVDNVLARREDNVLFLPVHPHFADGDRIDKLVDAFVRANRLFAVKHRAVPSA